MFLVFPLSTPFKVGGVGLGALTPVFVLIFNTIGWGIPAYAWFRLAGEGFCNYAQDVIVSPDCSRLLCSMLEAVPRL